MERIRVQVNVPRKVAARDGQISFGAATVVPTAQEWAALPVEQREWLDQIGTLEHDPLGQNRVVLASADLGWPVVAARIGELYAEAMVKRAEAAAKREAEIGRLLERSDEDWISTDWERGVRVPTFRRPPNGALDDPRIAAVEERLRPEIERRRAEVLARHEAEQEALARAKEQERIANAAERAACEASMRAWAIAFGPPELARAAREGYEVSSEVLRRVVDQVHALSDVHSITLQEGTLEWNRSDWEDRPAPSAFAFDLRDAIARGLASVKKHNGVDLELLRVQRIERREHSDHVDRYTAVIVLVSCPIAPRYAVVFRAE